MAVHNVDKWIEESITSVLEQTIGFKENIQLILVNDGSTDHSYSVCMKYRDMYPNNVVAINQENKGASAARNRGLREIKGKICQFSRSRRYSLD